MLHLAVAGKSSKLWESRFLSFPQTSTDTVMPTWWHDLHWRIPPSRTLQQVFSEHVVLKLLPCPSSMFALNEFFVVSVLYRAGYAQHLILFILTVLFFWVIFVIKSSKMHYLTDTGLVSLDAKILHYLNHIFVGVINTLFIRFDKAEGLHCYAMKTCSLESGQVAEKMHILDIHRLL